MWMMGYNDHHHHGGGGELKDSFNITTARKLRPLIPRPLHQQQQQQQQQPTNPNNNINNNFQTTQQYHQLVSNTNTNTTEYHHHHHHQNMMMMMSKKELNIGQQVVVSSRWNPTPEQLRALEELYRRGTRTPSAEQIQHITAQLRRYGKIEGKNVFYWFQNHKARERQKRRRQIMESSSSSSLSPDNDNQNHQEEMTLLEGSNNINKTKNWVPTSTSTTNTLLEECNVSIERSGKATGESDQWTHHHHDHHHHQFNQGELQQQQQQQHRRNFITERNATWQTMQLSCLPLLPTTCHVITTTNNNPNPNITTTAATSLLLTTTSTMGQRQSLLNYNYNNKNNNIDIFKTTPYRDENYHEEEEDEDHEDEEESQTLELFPLRSGNYYNTEKENDVSANGIATSVTTTNTTTCQFIEFLPLKQ
ncbi:hypothetical protein CsatA_000142 [Cannabis sativa]